ncbi:hypothetical protein CEXT_146011 [Caerostris extrusa]|uniref:Uncharacterized protein n=1 Tax=Caerostris extrusa TaxID=172846 RepID=A0AAV4PA48_CAEEX|nr:hypothetical protein CEXT_146011 [Caerostris extrusa]
MRTRELFITKRQLLNNCRTLSKLATESNHRMYNNLTLSFVCRISNPVPLGNPGIQHVIHQFFLASRHLH